MTTQHTPAKSPPQSSTDEIASIFMMESNDNDEQEPKDKVAPSSEKAQDVTTRTIVIKDKATAPSKLTGVRDWNRYCRQMETYLRTLNLLHYIQKEEEDEHKSELDSIFSNIPTGTLSHTEIMMMRSILTKVQKKDPTKVIRDGNDTNESLCMNKIETTISNALYSVIQKESTARGMWIALESHCKGEASGERQLLKQQFDTLQLKPTTVEKFSTEFRNLIFSSLGFEMFISLLMRPCATDRLPPSVVG